MVDDPGAQDARGSRPGCGPRRRPTRGRRCPPRGPGCRPGARRGPPWPSRCCCGCGWTASRTAGPRPGRPAPAGARPGPARPGPVPRPGRRDPRSSMSRTWRVHTGGVHGDGRLRRHHRPFPSAGTEPDTCRPRTAPTVATARSISASDTSREGANRRTSGRGALMTRPASSASRQAGAGELVGQHRGQQQPLAPHRGHAGQRLESGPQAGPAGPGPGRDVLGLHHRQRGPGRRHGQGLAAEGAPVVAGNEGRRHLGPGPARPDRHPVAQGLGHGHHVGLDAQVLEPEPPPGAAQPGLDLVHHQQDVPVGAQLAQADQVVRRRHDHPGLPHDGLDQDGGHPVGVAGGVHGVEVVVGDVVEALGQGQERQLLLGLTGGGQRGQGPPVEGVPGADHAEPVRAGPPAGQLEGALVGLGPRVAEEHLAAGPLGAARR